MKCPGPEGIAKTCGAEMDWQGEDDELDYWKCPVCGCELEEVKSIVSKER